MNLLKNINWNGRTFGFDLLMINDHQRNQFYHLSLGDCTGKVVLDIGSGTGLLSVMAVQAGADHVYSFEKDPQNHTVMKSFIDASGMSDKITAICADILSVDRWCWDHRPIDIVITETFANDCFTENFAFLVQHVRRKFNMAQDHRWIPESIELKIGLTDLQPCREFDPGVALPDQYHSQIQSAVQIYRDHFYHAYDEINMPVAQIPLQPSLDLRSLDRFSVDDTLKMRLDSARYDLYLDHSGTINPYLKIEWILHSGDQNLWLNQCSSWRNIAFKINRSGGNDFYLRFNPLTHSFLCSQSEPAHARQ